MMKKCLVNKSIVLVFLGIFFLGVLFVRLSFSFQLKGDKLVEIVYNTEYQEKGAKVTFFHQDFSKDVEIDGVVDTKTVGKYTVRYSYHLGFIPLERTREVNVIDNVAPIIELQGSKEQNICPKQEYEEEGFTAIDDYDGVLTDKVEVIPGEDSIKYKVIDSSGNSTVVERSVLKKDREAPKIRLSSGETVYVKQGGVYQEFGYTAIDNCDGDISDKVQVEGTVDTNTLGTYEIKYTVEDSSGQSTEVIRKVIVNAVKTSTSTGKPGVIYLTFDDGPTGSGSTAKILDVLKEEDVKATFFVTGSGPDSLIQREFQEGHTVALHTYSHNYQNIYASTENYFADLAKIQTRVQNLTGYVSSILRFPGGSNNTVSAKYSSGLMKILRREVENRGFVYFDWNVDASDAWQCAKKNVSDKKTCVYNNVISGLSKSRSNVVLMHDIKSYTADALKDIIQYAKNHGYVFEALSNDTKPVHFQ